MILTVEEYRTIARSRWTEAQFLKAVIGLAKDNGWVCAHFRPARTAKGWRTPCQADAKGFPDILAVKGSHLIVAELKCGKGKPTATQEQWLAAFRLAGIPAYIWRPAQWSEIVKILEAV